MPCPFRMFEGHEPDRDLPDDNLPGKPVGEPFVRQKARAFAEVPAKLFNQLESGAAVSHPGSSFLENFIGEALADPFKADAVGLEMARVQTQGIVMPKLPTPVGELEALMPEAIAGLGMSSIGGPTRQPGVRAAVETIGRASQPSGEEVADFNQIRASVAEAQSLSFGAGATGGAETGSFTDTGSGNVSSAGSIAAELGIGVVTLAALAETLRRLNRKPPSLSRGLNPARDPNFRRPMPVFRFGPGSKNPARGGAFPDFGGPRSAQEIFFPPGIRLE